MLRHGSHMQFYLPITPCLPFLRKHSPAGATRSEQISNCRLLLIYRPRKDERLSCPGWLTYSGRFTHISRNPSAAGGTQERESSPAKDRRSTSVPRNQRDKCSKLTTNTQEEQADMRPIQRQPSLTSINDLPNS